MTVQKKNVIYENIVVIVIQLLNAEELLFEDNSDILLEQYRGRVLECSNILQQEDGCKDIILYNTCIGGIFEGRYKEAVEKVLAVAREINDLLEHVNSCREDSDCEKLVYGIGVASGEAVTFALEGTLGENRRSVWIGPVFGRAHAMAQMAGIDGRRRIMVADTIDNI